MVEIYCILHDKDFDCTIIESIPYISIRFIFRCEQPTLLAMDHGVKK